MNIDHPNYGDDIIPSCPECGRNVYAAVEDGEGNLICKCGYVWILGGKP